MVQVFEFDKNENIKEIQQTLERVDKKIDGYEERVLIKEEKLKRMGD